MRIEVDQLKETGVPFANSYAPADLQLGDELTCLVAETNVAGRAGKKREQVRLQGTITTAVEVCCDRCAAPVVVRVNTDFDVTYIPAELEAAPEEATELQADDLSFAVYEGDGLDLDELVREQVLLALPTRQLCREDCRGLCLTCSADLNTQICRCEQPGGDPRWAVLAALQKSDK
ncbi:MAG: YceD family protein [Pyrinomonadaceae bacterium]